MRISYRRPFRLLAPVLLLAAGACSDQPDPTSPSIATDPAFAKGGPQASPTNAGRIFFVSGMGGNHDIYSVNHDGTDLRRLTFTPEHEGWPSVSPDGKKVAYLRSNGSGWDIWTMNVDGSRQKLRLAEFESVANMYNPAWSPDGRTLAFSYQEAGTLKFRMGLLSANKGAPTILPFEGRYPSWSPEGDYLAYVALIPGEGPQVATIRPDGTEFTQRTSASNCCSMPRWSPDGSRILYTAVFNGSTEYRTVGISVPDGGIPTTAEPSGAMAGWSPDGNRIAYAAGGDLRIVYGSGGSDTVILAGVNPSGRIDWSR